MPTINVIQTNASETAKGIVEEATQAEVNAGTDTGATGAKLFVVPSKYLAGILLKVLTGFNTGTNNPVLATDTLGQALAKYQGQINARATTSDLNSGLSNTLTQAQTYADALVVGLWDDRGSFDASGGAYPSSGGSGSAGAILKGDIWTISVAGTLPTGQAVEVGDVVRALTDTPGNTQANWAITQNNIGYVPLNRTSVPCEFIVACSDMTTAITAATDKAYFDAPYDFTLTEVTATLFTAQGSGNTFTVDIHKNTTTVLSTKITIENGEDSSLDATTQPVISTTSFTKGDRITIDVDQIGNGTAKGLIVTLVGTHSV